MGVPVSGLAEPYPGAPGHLLLGLLPGPSHGVEIKLIERRTWEGIMRRPSFIVLAGVSLLLVSSVSALAGETLTVEDLISKLQNKAPAEGNSAGSKGLSQEDLERSQRNRLYVQPRVTGGRDLTIEERHDVAETARQQDLPTADLEVYFEFDSAVIGPAALPVLRTLGQALSDGRLAGGTFIVGGHTDAKGEADYNQRLSQRRAQAVRDFLIANFPIAPDKLMATGYGEEQLKAPKEPLAGVNRRVQVINWTDVAGR